MKKLLILGAFITLLFTGCSTQKSATAYDDVYNTSSSDMKKEPARLANEDLSSPGQATVDHQSTSKNSSATWYDEYSNNPRNDTTVKKSYYDVYNEPGDQTDNSDVNVYVGSSWSPYFWGPAISFGFSWGYPYYGYYDPFYYGGYYGGYPYYWYYPYYCYGYYGWGGYWNGCYYGYYDGSWGYYPYSTSYYYGPRKMMSSSGNYGYYNRRDGSKSIETVNNRSTRENTPRRDNRSGGGGSTLSDLNTRSVQPVNAGNVRSTSPAANQRTSTSNTRGNNGTYKYDRAKVNDAMGRMSNAGNRTNPNYNRTRNDANTRTQVNNSRGNGATVQDRQPMPRYARPEQGQMSSRTETQNYSSPAYRQPKSSQEYISPANRPSGSNERSTFSGSPNQRNNVNSQGGNTHRITPGNSNSNVRNYSPSGTDRSTPSYSTPSRSSSSPSYSSPSRSSSPSYSSPSRSGGSGGGGSHSGGSSGSGGGGGGHRR